MHASVSLLAVIAAAILPVMAQAPTNATIRYMPFGDSITDYGCWRAWIWERLRQDGYGVDLVGTRKAEAACRGLVYDRDHEGHPGHQAANIVRQGQLADWLRQNPADVVTMHLGTNDILLGGRRTADIIAAFSTLVDQMRASNPGMRIIVAQIIPLPAASRAVQDLNQAIPAWASSKNSSRSPIWVVDQWTNFSGGSDLYDGIHPSESGDLKISNVFYPALIRAIESIRQGNGTP